MGFSATAGKIIGITVLMFFWLSLVIITLILVYKKYRYVKKDSLKKQFSYLVAGFAIIFIGDLIHTIGLDISIALNDNTGSITIFGNTFAFQSFALFFDSFAFILFYVLWELFIVERYKDGKLAVLDKVILVIAVITLFSILFAPFYTMSEHNYTVLIYAIHNIGFILFGLLTVLNLLFNSQKRLNNNINGREERSLNLAAWGFVVSFIFFVLTLALLPINSKFGMMMVPKTFAYAFSLISLNLGLFKPKVE